MPVGVAEMWRAPAWIVVARLSPGAATGDAKAIHFQIREIRGYPILSSAPNPHSIVPNSHSVAAGRQSAPLRADLHDADFVPVGFRRNSAIARGVVAEAPRLRPPAPNESTTHAHGRARRLAGEGSRHRSCIPSAAHDDHPDLGVANVCRSATIRP